MRFSLLLSVLGAAAVEIPAQKGDNGLYRRSESATIQPVAAANTEAPVQDGYAVNSPVVQTYGADTEPETSLAQAPQVTQSVSNEEDDKKDDKKQEDTSVAVPESNDAATETSPKMIYNIECSCHQPAPQPTITGGYSVDPPVQVTTSQPTVVPYPPPAPVTTTSTTEDAPPSSTSPTPEPVPTTSESVVPYPPPGYTYGPPPDPPTTTSV
ncbi:uncharacterized protein B0J16DRAFT_303096, partial [Fusarium flagelliforme]